MKKILFLGASQAQMPAIECAKKLGAYIITADNRPNNPGHKIADENYNISTVDTEKILLLAHKLKIDAIISYASDPGALTAAIVSQELNLKSSGVNAVKILSNKNAFRNFLKENSFNVPDFLSSNNLKFLEDNFFNKKSILKPVDSSGSKGVFIINNKDDLKNYFAKALKFSNTKEVILEEFIEKKFKQIHGEGFFANGHFKYLILGDQYFSSKKNPVPISTIFPSEYHKDIMSRVVEELEKALNLLNYYGPLNIEVIRDKEDKIYLLELGPRSGGNFMLELAGFYYNQDLICYQIKDILDKKNHPAVLKQPKTTNYYGQLILNSPKDGIFKGINIPKYFKKILMQKIYYNPGDQISKYKNSGDVVGVIIFKFENIKEAEEFIYDMRYWKWIELENN